MHTYQHTHTTREKIGLWFTYQALMCASSLSSSLPPFCSTLNALSSLGSAHDQLSYLETSACPPTVLHICRWRETEWGVGVGGQKDRGSGWNTDGRGGGGGGLSVTPWQGNRMHEEKRGQNRTERDTVTERKRERLYYISGTLWPRALSSLWNANLLLDPEMRREGKNTKPLVEWRTGSTAHIGPFAH